VKEGENVKIIHIPSPMRRATYHRLPDKRRYELPFYPSFMNLVYIDRLRNPSWFTPMQNHDYFELCYIAEGSGWFILDGVKLEAAQGDLFVTKPHEVHSGGASGEGSYVLYSMGFTFKGWSELEKDFYMLDSDRLVQDSSRAIQSWFEKLILECEQDEVYAAIKAHGYMTALLVDILRCYANQVNSHSLRSTVQPYIKNVLEQIHRTPIHSIEVAELAHKAGISRSHLDREFKKLLGVTLGEYIRHYKLEQAIHLLRQTDHTITEISDRCGFDSVQAFCMFFKRHTGKTPQAIRNHEEKR
jgi:AraC-like DNA-binding protein